MCIGAAISARGGYSTGSARSMYSPVGAVHTQGSCGALSTSSISSGGDCHSSAGGRLSSDAHALVFITNATTGIKSTTDGITNILFIFDLLIPILVRLFLFNIYYTAYNSKFIYYTHII
ncbi:hypothetical protein ACFLU5_05970 [Bacteroidota bacterium]